MPQYPDPFYMMQSYKDMARLYPYLAELREQEPPIYANLEETDPGFSGYVQGTRYGDKDVPRLVVIDEEGKKTLIEPHEYMHYGIDVSPNWSYMIPPTEERLNYPTPSMRGYMSFLGGYPRNLAFEEGAVRTMVPDEGISKELLAKPETFFTESQLEILPYLRRYLQYGPSWGSLAGEEESSFIIDPTYRGKQVQNLKGPPSSERTMTFQHGKTHYVVPTLFRGKQLRPEEAWTMFRRGQLPAVAAASTKEEANKMATERSKMLGEEKRGRGLEFAPPVQKPKANKIRQTGKGIYNKAPQERSEEYSWSDMIFYP